jgi:hypothetical protein
MATSYSYRQGNNDVHTFKGTAPTAREDGTPLAEGEIDHYIRLVAYQAAAGGSWKQEQMNVQLVDGSFSEPLDVDAVAPGHYEVWYRTVDTDGAESKDSNSIALDILAPLAAPLPPVVTG